MIFTQLDTYRKLNLFFKKITSYVHTEINYLIAIDKIYKKRLSSPPPVKISFILSCVFNPYLNKHKVVCHK